MSKVFLVLALGWAAAALYQFVTLSGDPDRWRITFQFLGTAAINGLVALFLNWLRERRERADR